MRVIPRVTETNRKWFAVGSLASSLAQTEEWIIVSRVVQGVGAAGMGVTGMVIGLLWLAIFVPEKSYPLLLPGFVLWGRISPLLLYSAAQE